MTPNLEKLVFEFQTNKKGEQISIKKAFLIHMQSLSRRFFSFNGQKKEWMSVLDQKMTNQIKRMLIIQQSTSCK